MVDGTASGGRTRAGSAHATILARATGHRSRSGTAHTQTSGGARGVRARRGTVKPALLLTATAAGARRRGGFAFGSATGPIGAGLPFDNPFDDPPTSTGLPPRQWRWRIEDPLTGASYTFDINPNKGGSPKRSRKLTEQQTVAVDGKPLLFEGAQDVFEVPFSGVVLTRAHYDAMVAWSKKRYLILLTDDLGRQMQALMISFKPKRDPRRNHPDRHTYDAVIRVFAYGTAPTNLDPPSTLIL